MKRILTLAIAVLASAGAAIAANWQIRDIDILVQLRGDGTALIREIWDMNAKEGTEVYIPRENLGDIEISSFTVQDESGRSFVSEDYWNTNRSLEAKAGRCGINDTGRGVELCWGLGSYGDHVFTIQYIMSNAVKSLNDYDMLHLQLVNDRMAAAPEHVRVRIEAPGRQIDDSWVRMWGFGFYGTTAFAEDGSVIFESTEPFSRNSSVIALLRFDKGYFHSPSEQSRDFEEVLSRAMEGADFGDEEEAPSLMDILGSFLGMILAFIAVLAGSKKLAAAQKRKLLGCDPKDIAWSRDVPFDGDIYCTDYVLDTFGAKRAANAIASAIILRLVQKNYILVSKDDRDRVELSFNELADRSKLDEHENALLAMMLEASGSDHILQNKEFSRWSSKSRNQNVIRNWADKIQSEAGVSLLKNGFMAGRRFTVKGQAESQKALGFKKFLEEFTLIDERETIEVGLWQDYLVFGALFGIAERVAKQLKDINPQVFEEVVCCPPDVYFNVLRMNDLLSRSITNARYVSPEVATQSRGGFGGVSSFGGGGGFSGGGHGGGVR